jgi:hypothetical protein
MLNELLVQLFLSLSRLQLAQKSLGVEVKLPAKILVEQ